MTISKTILVLLLLSLMLNSCSDTAMDNSKAFDNEPPTVSVFLLSGVTLNRTSSTQILHWDGKDADGLVVGFYYTFGNSSDKGNWVFLPDTTGEELELLDGDTAFWRFTTERTDTFSLEILTDELIYTFSVLALDNDSSLSTEPAVVTLPIKNSRPEVFFLGEVDTASFTVKIPDTTFTIASFTWGVTDEDGEETIAKFQYTITSPGDSLSEAEWIDLPANKRSIILSGTDYETEEDVTFDDRLTKGDHAFYLRAIDVATAVSDVIRLPDDEEEFWYVKEPVGETILIDDWAVESTDGRDFYIRVLNSLDRKYSVLNIKPQGEKFLLSKVALTETVKLFKLVIWYADITPKLEEADAALSKFTERGGKILFSTLFSQFASNQGNPLEFTPVDSISLLKKPDGSSVLKIFKSWNISLWPDPLISDDFPDTLMSAFPSSIISTPKEIVPNLSARVLYRYQPLPDRYIGEPVVMVEDASRSFIFTSIPLHYFDGDNNMVDLIATILTREFGL